MYRRPRDGPLVNTSAAIEMNEQSKQAVLIVEDVSEICAQMETMLAKKGYRAVRATNAQEAIQFAETDRPAIILTDLDLPTLDSLMELVRGHRDLKNTVVAVIDTNHPNVTELHGLKVLANLDQLDDLLESATQIDAVSSD